MAKRGRVEPQARIIIQKHIPNSMGLGGGSSDAACALMALNRLWGLDLPQEELAQIAAALGSDVPFFFGEALLYYRAEEKM